MLSSTDRRGHRTQRRGYFSAPADMHVVEGAEKGRRLILGHAPPKLFPVLVLDSWPTKTEKFWMELDCKGLKCPMPIVRISRTMKQLRAGDVLTVEATDPAFEADLQAWVNKTENRIASFSKTDDSVQRAVIEKR